VAARDIPLLRKHAHALECREPVPQVRDPNDGNAGSRSEFTKNRDSAILPSGFQFSGRQREDCRDVLHLRGIGVGYFIEQQSQLFVYRIEGIGQLRKPCLQSINPLLQCIRHCLRPGLAIFRFGSTFVFSRIAAGFPGLALLKNPFENFQGHLVIAIGLAQQITAIGDRLSCHLMQFQSHLSVNFLHCFLSEITDKVTIRDEVDVCDRQLPASIAL
jgi:hypothetical protein